MSGQYGYKRRLRAVVPPVQQLANGMRKIMSPAELRLWQALRNRALEGIKVRRQHPVDRFILDYYVPASKLAIEVDGLSHELQQERDLERTAVLASHGIRVIRFTNEQVLNNLQHVLYTIHVEAARRDLV